MTILYHIGDLEFTSTNPSDLKKELEAWFSYKGCKPEVEITGDHVRVDIDDELIGKAEAMVKLAFDCANRGNNGSAKDFLRKALAICPLYADAHRTLAQILMMEGKVDDAIPECREALRCEPTNLWAIILMGNLLLRKGDPEGAMRYYDRAILLHPDNPLALNNVAGVKMQLKQYDEALPLFDKVLSLNGTSPNAWYGKAVCLRDTGHEDEAFEVARLGCIRSKDVPENPGARASLENLLVDLAKGCASSAEDYMILVGHEKDLIEKDFGVPVDLVKDESLPVLGKLSYWKHHGDDRNLVRYNPGKPFTPHYMMHELMHLRMNSINTKEGVNKVVFSTEEDSRRFLNRFTSQFRPLVQRIGREKFDAFYKKLHNGLASRAMNSPLDLFVEDMVFSRYPEFRHLQLLSLIAQEKENISADKQADQMRELPRIITEASRTMNIIQSLQLKDLFGLDYVSEHGGTRQEVNNADMLYKEWQAYKDSYNPGDEYELLEYFLQNLRLQDLLQIRPEDEFLAEAAGVKDSYDFNNLLPPLTEEEKKEAVFQQKHRDGEDPAITMMMAMYMKGAIDYMSTVSKDEVRTIARDIAVLGLGGISPDKGGYSIPSLPGREFGGYEMLAWYYVSWAAAFPEMVDKLNLPFSSAFQTALMMYRANNDKKKS